MTIKKASLFSETDFMVIHYLLNLAAKRDLSREALFL